MMSKHAEAAEAFRALLRTDTYPEGAEIAAVQEIRKVTGVSHNTAARALSLLASQGELLVEQGRLTRVLPRPADNDMDRLLADLAEAVHNYQVRHRAVQNALRHYRRRVLLSGPQPTAAGDPGP